MNLPIHLYIPKWSSLRSWATLIILTGIWHCPIFLISQQIHMVHQIHVFSSFFFKIGKKKMGNWRFSKLKGKKNVKLVWSNLYHCTHETTCIWCSMCICCEIRKIGQCQIPVKIISVPKQKTGMKLMKLITYIYLNIHNAYCSKMAQSDILFQMFNKIFKSASSMPYFEAKICHSYSCNIISFPIPDIRLRLEHFSLFSFRFQEKFRENFTSVNITRRGNFTLTRWTDHNKGLVTLKHVVPLDINWNKFHASHWNSFLPFFLLANGRHESYFKWHLMVPHARIM